MDKLTITKFFICTYLVCLITGCTPNLEDAKKLGFDTVEQMKNLQGQGFKSKFEWEISEIKKEYYITKQKEIKITSKSTSHLECKGSYEPEKCEALYSKMENEKPEETEARRNRLEAETLLSKSQVISGENNDDSNTIARTNNSNSISRNDEIADCWMVYTSLTNFFASAGYANINVTDGPLGVLNVRAKASSMLLRLKYIDGKLPHDWIKKYENTMFSTHRRLFNFTNQTSSPDDMPRHIIRKFEPEMDVCEKKFP